MGTILYKRVNQEGFSRYPTRLVAGLLVLSLATGQAVPLFATEMPAESQLQLLQKGISAEEKAGKITTDSKSEKKSATTSDFLISNGTLQKTDDKSPDPITALLQNVVDGTISKKQTNKNGEVVVTVQLNGKTSKNIEFLGKAEGPLQSGVQSNSVTFTLSGNGTKIEEAKFTDGNVKYTLTFSDDSKNITRSVVSDMKDETNIENNYTIVYSKDMANKDLATITFLNYQNDGSSTITFSKTGENETTLKFYGDISEITPFRTTVIKENKRGTKTIHSELQFGDDPPFTEYEAVINSKSTDLTFQTAYGLYTTKVGAFENLYDMIENKISLEISTVEVKQFFLSAFEQMIGKSVFTVEDLKNNIVVVNEEPTYARLNYMGFSLILTCNVDPETYETKPIIIVPDINKNGEVDSLDLKTVKNVLNTARMFFDTKELIDYKDFAANAIVLDAKNVLYQGQVIKLDGRHNFLKLSYKDGRWAFIIKLAGRKNKFIRKSR